MSQLTDWLASLDDCTDIREIAATIDGVRYEGATYRQGGELRYYLLGALPKAYKRSTKTAFVINGEDWYIAYYMPKERITEQYAPYHPCGEHFMLCKWSVRSGEAIDQYHYWRGEKKYYRRIPVTIEVLL